MTPHPPQGQQVESRFAETVQDAVSGLVAAMIMSAETEGEEHTIPDATAGLFAACTHFVVRFIKPGVTDDEIVDMITRYAREFIPQVRAHLASEAMGEPEGRA